MLRVLSSTLVSVAMSVTLASCATAGGTTTEAVAVAEAGAGSPVQAATAFRATGNEPSWRLDVGPTEMSLLTDFGQTRVVAPTPTVRVAGATTTYVGRTDQGELQATIVDRVCVDSMSGMPHPQTVTVVAGGQTLHGCGGEPVSLLQGEWTVVEIGGAPLVAGSRVTLSFELEGRLSGNSSCNRFMSEYSLSGEGLAISKAAGTRMMCDAALMEQERAFLDALAATQIFSIAPDGALLLQTHDGRTIKARRR
jgi:heat shock protein HslJ